MNWYYALNNEQKGPVPEMELGRLVSDNVIFPATLVWQEGMPDWKPLVSMMPQLFASSPSPRVGGVAVPGAQKDLVVQQLREGVTPAGQDQMIYAGFWIRFVALFVDGIIMQGVGFILGLIVGTTAGAVQRSGEVDGLTIGLAGGGFIIGVLYEVILIGKFGATLGKMAVGLKVVRPDGSKISMGTSTGRYFAKFLSGIILGIGYFMAAFDPEKRALHDRICETRVIRIKR